MSVDSPTPEKSRTTTATQFFLRGLAISLPPILTLVILIWIGRGINDYVIHPISTVVRYSLAHVFENTRPIDQFVPSNGLPPLEYCDHNYRLSPALKSELQKVIEKAKETNKPSGVLNVELQRRLVDEVYVPFGDIAVPYPDFAEIAKELSPNPLPDTAIGIYMELVTRRHFQGVFGPSAFAISLTIVILYFLGRIVTIRVGAWCVNKFETLFLGKLPVVSNVYSSVKQVTDFLFTERKIEYNRVVAIEYPRRGIWSLGFATGDSLLEMTASAGEPLLSVLIPTSPMPVTGYTINIPKSEVVDLDITIDQAFQFCLSCGVLVPSQQRVTPELLQQELTKRLTGITPPTRPTQSADENSQPDDSPTTSESSVEDAIKPDAESH